MTADASGAGKDDTHGKKKMSECGWSAAAIEILGYDREKIGKAVEACVQAMEDLTIEESKIARKSLGHTLDEMYKRNPDTKISEIRAEKRSGLLAQNPEQKNNSIHAL